MEDKIMNLGSGTPSQQVPTFTAHNIRLDDGTTTIPEKERTIDKEPLCIAAKKLINELASNHPFTTQVLDLGCLEGGYAVELARMGTDFLVTGIEIRRENLACCRYVQSKTNSRHLSFLKDDVWDLEKNAWRVDAVFCSGLLYHLDRPKEFLEMLGRVTGKLLIVNTHYALPDRLTTEEQRRKFILSAEAKNEGLIGRWYREYEGEGDFANRENFRWSSWDNRRSFWLMKDELMKAMREAGFDLVMEEFSTAEPENLRGTFVGVKSV